MWSRYGGLKQIDSFGPQGQTILEYSIYDAIQAGFDHVVLVIRESFAQDFKNILGARFDHKIKVDYAFQGMELDYAGVSHVTREKPRGTWHAVLVAKDLVDQPFCVINADDYYGRSGFVEMYNFLTTSSSPTTASMVAYPLQNTLSDHGTVNRWICAIDDQENLSEVVEHLKIQKKWDVAKDENGHIISLDSPASMNLLWFHHTFFDYLENEFLNFVKENNQETRKEFYIPSALNSFIHTWGWSCKVLMSNDSRYGVTYPDDKEMVVSALSGLHAAGVYPRNLRA